MRLSILTPSLLAAAAVADLPDVTFDRYQIIIDRAPFGALAPPVNLAAANAGGPPPPGFADSLRMAMIVEDDDTGEKRIGFVDKRNNRPYTMTVGDAPIDGITVVSVDFEKEEAVLQQGAEMALMKLSSGEVQKIEGGQPVPNPAGGPPQPPAQNLSYQDRRRMRAIAAQPPAEIPKVKYNGEELNKHLSEYKLEVIRQGLPPLPIPLTKEEDDKLVNEGVLPPQP